MRRGLCHIWHLSYIATAVCHFLAVSSAVHCNAAYLRHPHLALGRSAKLVMLCSGPVDQPEEASLKVSQTKATAFASFVASVRANAAGVVGAAEDNVCEVVEDLPSNQAVMATPESEATSAREVSPKGLELLPAQMRSYVESMKGETTTVAAVPGPEYSSSSEAESVEILRPKPWWQQALSLAGNVQAAAAEALDEANAKARAANTEASSYDPLKVLTQGMSKKILYKKLDDAIEREDYDAATLVKQKLAELE
mmetsp:Transcript_32910/g.54361  ORF Transcript_32910/g.54361 Transcript_32910/m.54361 type:complete len:253 (-) Transcript_32910:336-1094(-)|eukprot:CAMPEP_0119304704 /NCGR_PEP_ID=MMETSP1333-20130426/5859_1 /TAXON_ID=418940 /ORGANISM="Scyphosphaera apsteinii, Strain RCC1455" /LENGTH=252 /DNA_ID=CAMNT_0007307635 /DNA_START=137 /DNA_END=895 /DNA_ORIENTATION=+